jgi:hypothetical protein
MGITSFISRSGQDGKALRSSSEAFGWKIDTNNPGGRGMVREEAAAGWYRRRAAGLAGQVTFHIHTDDAGRLARSKLGGRILIPDAVAPGRGRLCSPTGGRRRPEWFLLRSGPYEGAQSPGRPWLASALFSRTSRPVRRP